MADHDHKHGSMDTSSQEKMFASFMSWVSWSVVIIIATLILLYLVNG